MYNKAKAIESIALKDHLTNDVVYNRGLKRIRQVGYTCCFFEDDVKYYCLCNGYS